MNIICWLKNWFSNQSKAQSLYRRGMAKAKNNNFRGAINDYTAAINMPDVQSDLKALALYYRALVHLEVGDNQNCAVDFHAVLAMDEALINIKSMARQKLAKMES